MEPGGAGDAAASSGAREHSVCFDQPGELIEEDFPLIGRKHCQKALIPGECPRLHARMHLGAERGEAEQPRPAVRSIHAAAEQAFRFELLDQQARIVAIDAEPCRKAALIEVGLAVDVGDHGILQRRQVFPR